MKGHRIHIFLLIASCFVTQSNYSQEFEVVHAGTTRQSTSPTSQRKEKRAIPPLFDTAFLSQPELVEKFLCDKGFEKISVATETQTLSGLILRRPNAHCTVVSIAGFFPGKMTGMATLYELLPETCNILFINLRGKGDSTGRLDLCKIWNYGVNEYEDVIGTIKYCTEHADLKKSPLIIHGICAGSFHALKALYHLAQHNDPLCGKIAGIVIDSGFASILEMSKCSLPNYFMKLYGKNTYTSAIVGRGLCTLYGAIRWSLDSGVKLCLRQQYETGYALTPDMMQTIATHMPTVKFLFMHGTGDADAPWANLKPLADKIPATQKTIWLKEETSCHHGSLHLKYQDEYKTELCQFLKKFTAHEQQKASLGYFSSTMLWKLNL